MLPLLFKLANPEVATFLVAALGVVAGLSGNKVKGKGSSFWNKVINRLPIISIVLICVLVLNYIVFLDKCIVPDLSNLSLSEAQQILDELELNCKPDEPDDYSFVVSAQYPEPDKIVSKDTDVILLTSQYEQQDDSGGYHDYAAGFVTDLPAVFWGDSSIYGTVELIPNEFGEVPDIDNLEFDHLLWYDAIGKDITDIEDDGSYSLTITENDFDNRFYFDFEVLFEGNYSDGEYQYDLRIIHGENVAAIMCIDFVYNAGEPTVIGYSSYYVEDGEIYEYTTSDFGV